MTNPFAEPDDPLEGKVWFGKYEGATWSMVAERDLGYIRWVLYTSDIKLSSALVEALEEILDEQYRDDIDNYFGL